MTLVRWKWLARPVARVLGHVQLAALTALVIGAADGAYAAVRSEGVVWLGVAVGPGALALLGAFTRAVRDGRHALVPEAPMGRTELFDVAADPGEKHDVSGDPAQGGRVRSMLHLPGASLRGNLFEARRFR